MKDIFKTGLKEGAIIGFFGGSLAMTISTLFGSPKLSNLDLIISSTKTISLATISGSIGGYLGIALVYYIDKYAKYTYKKSNEYS